MKNNMDLQTEIIPIEKIVLTENTRKTIDKSDLNKLKENIEAVGLLQPIGVIRVNSHYNLAWGFRRLEAKKLLNHETISAVIIPEGSDPDALKIIENLQRKDITPLELAAAIKDYKEKSGLTFSEMAGILGRSLTDISKINKLNDLTKVIKTKLEKGDVDLDAALFIARYPEDEQREYCNSYHFDSGHIKLKDVKNFFKNRNLLVKNFPWSMEKEFDKLPKCSECPDRSSMQSALFPDLKKDDNCLNRNCMETKIKANLNDIIYETELNCKAMNTAGFKGKVIFVSANRWPRYDFSDNRNCYEKDDLKAAGKKDENFHFGIIVAADNITSIGQVHKYVLSKNSDSSSGRSGKAKMDDLSPEEQNRRLEIYKRKKDLIYFPMSIDIGKQLMSELKNIDYKKYKTIPTEALGLIADYIIDTANYEITNKLKTLFNPKKDKKDLSKIFLMMATAATYGSIENYAYAENYTGSNRYRRLREMAAVLGIDIKNIESGIKPKYDEQANSLKERFILRNKFNPEKKKQKKK